MFWVWSLLISAISLGYRIYINRGQTKCAPDEKVYATYAYAWNPGHTYAKAVEAFLAKSVLEIPPTRYGFFAICRLFCLQKTHWSGCFKSVTWVAAVSAALLAPLAFLITKDLPSSLLVASSPLSLFLSRKALQDSFTALLLLVGVWAIQLSNPWLLGVSVALALVSREALVLYLPALCLAWWVKTPTLAGPAAIAVGTVGAVVSYYAVGGRKLLEVFRKLKAPTDYVRRFQSGPPHRLLVDFFLVSPVVLLALGVLPNTSPAWLLCFLGASVGVHAFITPKNVRFLLVVDVGLRMLCAGLPGLWPWVVLVLGSVADLYLYRAFGKCEDPVTANLVSKSGMYSET